MNTRSIQIISLAVSLGFCNAVAFGGETLELLQGAAWRCMAVESNGKKASEEDGQRWTFTESKIIVEDELGKHEVEYRIDETVTPIAIDWWDPEPNGIWHGRGILRCDGKTLQLCGRVGLKREKLERPKAFETKDGGDVLRMVYFTRVK